MDSAPFVGDRLGKRDLFLATLAGIIFTIVYLVFAPKGMEPGLWEDLCIAAGLRPPATLFPGVWRLVTKGLISFVGINRIEVTLRIIGCLIGGVCVSFVYLCTRQVLAHLCRVKSLTPWNGFARHISFLATICFGAGDSMWQIVAPVTPGAFLFLPLLVAICLFLRWLVTGGLWRILAVMVLSGIVAAESTAGLVMPLVVYISYRLYLDALVNNKVFPDGEIPPREMMPKWRMFFSFLAGFALLASVNIWTFIAFGGMDASGWGAFEVTVHYIIGYYQAICSAATPVGWILSFTFSMLPFIVALFLFPMLCHDTEPIKFRPGLILLFAGVLALLQAGILPYTRLWAFSSGGVEIHSDFLECIFSFCTVVTIALAGSCFMLSTQKFFMYDGEDGSFSASDDRGYFMRSLVPWIIILCMIPVVLRIYRPVETEMRRIVSDALYETVRECGDAKFLFTDGGLDAGIELVAHKVGSRVKPLNMMSGPSNWEKYIRTRHFKEGSADFDLATTGTAVLLRVWAGERQAGMDDAAVQLGFEFWRRARRPLPRQSGLVARERGIDDAEVERGVKNAMNLAQRILYIAKNHPHAMVTEALSRAVSSVSWRISRFARMRDEEALANELDEHNEPVKHMMRLIDYEREKTFMQLTPYEGLRLALRRADFSEARRYAQTVLQMEPDDPEANFGTGMAYLIEEKLKEAEFYLERTLTNRPDEPAVLNNLSIIYRKTNRLDKALEYVKKAHELMPANEEITRTLRDTERAIETRKATLKSAFRQ